MDGPGSEAWDNGRELRGGVKSPGVEAGKGGLGNSRGTFCHLGAGCVVCCMALQGLPEQFYLHGVQL